MTLENAKVKKVDDGHIVGTNNGEFLSGLFLINSKRNIMDLQNTKVAEVELSYKTTVRIAGI